MSALATIFLLVNAVALLRLPRRWAPLPLLVGCCYMTLGQGIEIGPFSFTIVRMLIAFGFVRVLVSGERWSGGLTGLDQLMIVWSVWYCLASLFHDPAIGTLITHLGVVYTTAGFYFLLRAFCAGPDELVGLVKLTSILLAPIAVEMLAEQMTGHNMFSLFGGVPDDVLVREGRRRAQGPFAHPILAGTVGAVCIPLMAGIWHLHRKSALLGLAACLMIVLTCASSGPIMTVAIGCFALGFWRWRHLTRLARWSAVVGYFMLSLVMNRPVYFLMSDIDLAGGSTGWHRSRLIQSAFEHFGEWWFAGTDYTRHWMPTGVYFSENHTDITNHYLLYGVEGGFLSVLLFIGMLVAGFRHVSRSTADDSPIPADQKFTAWCIGSVLFAYVVTSFSIAFFDQSIFFLVLSLVGASSLGALQQSPSVSETRDLQTSHPPDGKSGAHPVSWQYR